MPWLSGKVPFEQAHFLLDRTHKKLTLPSSNWERTLLALCFVSKARQLWVNHATLRQCTHLPSWLCPQLLSLLLEFPCPGNENSYSVPFKEQIGALPMQTFAEMWGWEVAKHHFPYRVYKWVSFPGGLEGKPNSCHCPLIWACDAVPEDDLVNLCESKWRDMSRDIL